VRVLSRLPRLERQRQALPLIVLVDRSDCLTPFFDDQEECLEALRRVYGDGGVKIVWLPEGPSSNIEVDFEHDRISLSRGATVLALSDLGHYAGAQTRERWRACGERLRTCECQLVALMPVPRSRWRSDLTNLWPALAWENASSTLSSARPTSQELEERASQLIDRVDWACGIDFGLLREVRRLLPSDQADVGTEADAYTHARVRGNGHRVFYVDRRSAPALIPADESQAIVEIVRKWHRHRELTREVWFEDLLAKFGEAPADLDDIEALQTYAKRIAATLKSEGRERERLKPWVEGLKGKISEGAWRDTRLGAALMEAFAQLEGGAKARPNRPIQAWKLYQRGGEIVVWSPENPPESLAGLSLIGEIRSQAGWVEIDEGRRIDLETFSPLAQELGESSRIALQTDRQRVVLELLTRPEWANAGMGRDRYGLWAAFSVSGVMQRMRYIAPGRFWMGSPENEVGRYEDEGPRHEVELTRGYWLADTPCTQALWQAVMGDNPSHFQSPTRPVETITAEDTQQFCQRLNGRSSGSEVFRLPTEAEWEYACRAGTEASTYAGELEILGEHKAPLLNKIAWYGGNSGVDFDLREGVDSSQWPEKEFEHSRAGTRIVAQKLPNAWGLFDMLGNVWERCEDRFESYASERSVDPLGQKGGYRVIRGGSWNVSARRVRAAYRYEWRVGDSRYDLLGFRLARGQALAAPQASEAEPRAEELETVDEARRGTSRRRPPSRARSSAKQKRSKK
jgi:formylglycine-generating enzyme required for sulfatase activity